MRSTFAVTFGRAVFTINIIRKLFYEASRKVMCVFEVRRDALMSPPIWLAVAAARKLRMLNVK